MKIRHHIHSLIFGLLIIAGLLNACAGTKQLLPHALYYLSGPQGEAQVWRMDEDGLTTAQITHQSGGVDEFAVSPKDGGLAIISANQLFLLDQNGENPRLIADDRLVNKQAEDYAFRGFITDPVFSPDGRTLAYAFDGLHLYNFKNGTDEHVLTNLGNLLDEPFVFTKEIYAPGSWSPDGSQLLIVMSYYEGSTLAIMTPGEEQPFTRVRSYGSVCCNFNWSADGQSIWVANPYFTTNEPGLWQFDAQTGEGGVVIPDRNPDGSFNYVGWPYQFKSGEIYFFYANIERFSPEEGIPLTMMQSNADGSDPIELRSEKFNIWDVLWPTDGSFALILGRVNGDENHLLLVPTDGSAIQVLIDDITGLEGIMWGP